MSFHNQIKIFATNWVETVKKCYNVRAFFSKCQAFKGLEEKKLDFFIFLLKNNINQAFTFILLRLKPYGSRYPINQ